MSSLLDWLSGFYIPPFHFPGIGLSDVIDILIVAYMVYFVLRWIRQTRAWSLLKGVVLILLIAGLALVLQLNTVRWILQEALTLGLVTILVLFQPELRAALEQLGRGNIFVALRAARGGRDISSPTVNELVKAVKKMAAEKTGALIVLERDVALGEHEHTGIPVDAVVSSPLLVNIFEKNTPLHDGAVVVRHNRVAAAACILPLTAKDDVEEGLGTRHRAALGISEVSDALAVVVSEETGAISVASGGALTRNLNEYQLHDLLLAHTEPDAPKPRFPFFRRERT